MRPTIVAVLVSAASLAIEVPDASACSCVRRQPSCTADTGEIAFIGTPTSSVPIVGIDSHPVLRFTFAVDESLSGKVPRSTTIETASDTAACGFPFQVGRKYLVYARSTAAGYHVSFCSRTGPLEDRQADLALLKEQLAGKAQRRMKILISQFELALDGWFMHGTLDAAVPGVGLTIRGADKQYEATTDARGEVMLTGVAAGRYSIEPRLPEGYELQFERPISASVVECLAEVFVSVVCTPLKGVLRTADGAPAPAESMIRVARLDADNRITFRETTVAFTDDRGRWKLPGLPPGRYVVGINYFDAPSSRTPYPETWYPNARSRQGASVIEIRPETVTTIDFRLPAPLAAVSIAGQVVDSYGRPVVNVSVSLVDDDDPHDAGMPSERMVAYATTDNDGRFVVTGFRGGHYRLVASLLRGLGPGLRSRSIPTDMDAPTSNITIVLPR
ncbi:MAG TPA: carboxypeptidase regulatory-like domain-containing protein [Vicinamibacterales bacterium]|jgi:hypothetical protein